MMGGPHYPGSEWGPDHSNAGAEDLGRRGRAPVADMEELELRLIATRLREQQRSGEENNQWLASEESAQVRTTSGSHLGRAHRSEQPAARI